MGDQSRDNPRQGKPVGFVGVGAGCFAPLTCRGTAVVALSGRSRKREPSGADIDCMPLFILCRLHRSLEPVIEGGELLVLLPCISRHGTDGFSSLYLLCD